LPGDGRFLGMLPDLTLREEVVTLQPGDSLLLYSDGVTDAHNEANERYGLERLQRVFQGMAGQGTETLDRLAQDVNAWRGHAAAFDDVTMLLVEALAPNAGDQ
jgi:serine phosphatase RsbU (regulator of sigma subunit)